MKQLLMSHPIQGSLVHPSPSLDPIPLLHNHPHHGLHILLGNIDDGLEEPALDHTVTPEELLARINWEPGLSRAIRASGMAGSRGCWASFRRRKS
jgi:hypothetical protein